MEPEVTYAQVAFSKASQVFSKDSDATYAQVTFSKDSDVTYAQLRLPPTVPEKRTGREAPARTTVPTPGKPPAARLAHTAAVRVLGVLLCVLLVTAIILISLSVRWYGQLKKKTAEVTELAAKSSLQMERLTQVSERWEYTQRNLTQMIAEYGEMSLQFGNLSESFQQTNQTLHGVLKQQKQAAETLLEMWQVLQGHNQAEFFVATIGGNKVLLSWSCQQGWTLHSRHCYYFTQDIVHWQLARSKCKGHRADLVIVNSAEEQEFVKSRLADYGTSYWIGYNKVKGQWLWVDGSSTDLWFWKSGQPDNYMQLELCATTERTWNPQSWNDDNCLKNYKYICEKDADHMKINISGAY